MALIYKICSRPLWQEALETRQFKGAPVDAADGFIHFSTGEQVVETATRHFAGIGDLVLLAVEADTLGPNLRFETSRGGALFPHLYAALPVDKVCSAVELPLGPEGDHIFPAELSTPIP